MGLLSWGVCICRNHESHIITQVYGFAAELKAKYGKTAKVSAVQMLGWLLPASLLCCWMPQGLLSVSPVWWSAERQQHILSSVCGWPSLLDGPFHHACLCDCVAVYGYVPVQGLYTHMKRFFASLPLAALVENSTLILHGGLFRAPPAKAKAGGKRRRSTGGGALHCHVIVFAASAHQQQMCVPGAAD